MSIRELPTDPTHIAAAFLNENPRPLRYWREDFIVWNGRHYKVLDKDSMDAALAQFMNGSVNQKGEKFRTSKKIVGEVKSQIMWMPGVLLPTDREDRSDPHGKPIDLIPCRNGLLDLKSGELLPHSPDYLIFNTVEYNYDPTLLEPQEWTKFVQSMWPDDDGSEGGSIACLQEIMGLLLSGDGSMQKIFLFIGPPRCGKGTLQHALIKLIGKEHCAGVNSKAFSENFGLQDMIGKAIGFLPDQRSGRNGGAMTESLLQISGQDPVSINRKNKSHWMGVLPTRIVILTNDIPHLPDSSGVIATRFVPLVFEESFLGREDHELFNKLVPEMAQIMNWALEGLRRLRARGQFIITAQAEEMMQKIQTASAPHLEFFSENLIEDPIGVVVKTTVYEMYVDWCKVRGHKPCSHTIFCPRVERAFNLSSSHPRIGGKRERVWLGIRFQDCADQPEHQTPDVKPVFDTLVAEPRNERNARLIAAMTDESNAKMR
jgi:putative DNA primase/helicase